MHNLGHTLSCRAHDHLLHTPDAFVRAPLPGMTEGTATVHVGPAIGAAFTQYTAELAADGRLGETSLQRFLFVLEGSIEIDANGSKHQLVSGGYSYIPAGVLHPVTALDTGRVLVIEKAYQPTAGVAPPGFFVGAEEKIVPQPLLGDPDLQVRALVPASVEFDFAVNTLTFQPGAALPMVEVHVMEHGLLMLEGGGIYRLGECWHPVNAGDFIWMAPFCPQWFGALGKVPAKYILYKDWNRHPDA